MSANEGEGNAFLENGDHEFEDGQARNDRVQVNVVEADAIEEDGHGLDSQFDLSAAVVQMVARLQCKGSMTGSLLTDI